MAGNQLSGLRRGIKALEVLATAPAGLPFKALQQAFPDLVPSTLSRLLKVLVDEGMVRYEAGSRRYSLAERTGELAALIQGQATIARKMQPLLDRLAASTKMSAAFFEYKDRKIMLTAKAEQPEAFHYSGIGSMPAKWSHGMRRLCAAHLPATERKKLGPGQVPGVNKLKRMKVFINTEDDQPGLVRICSPVFYKESSSFAGVMGISFYRRFNTAEMDKLAEMVQQAATEANV